MSDSCNTLPAKKFRIAPTPSGFLHAGNGASFVLTAMLAAYHKAPLLLRIDDMDNERKRKVYLDDIFYSLDWLGIEWQEGPSGPDDFESKWSQRHRRDLYQSYLEDLRHKNEVYACACSRAGLANGIRCNCQFSLDDPSRDIAWKIRLQRDKTIVIKDVLAGTQNVHLFAQPDPVVRKKDKNPAYQICSICDDEYFKLNCIVRGMDLLASTGLQMELAQSVAMQAFPAAKFYHHPLVTDPQNRKLSKSADDYSLAERRRSGKSPVEIYFIASSWLGIEARADTISTLTDACETRLNSLHSTGQE